MIYLQTPKMFKPIFEVSSIHVEYKGKLLMLQRHDRPGNRESGKWGVPAGKLQKDESSIEAAIRELYEETGIKLTPDDLQHKQTVFIKYPDIDYIYHMFLSDLENFPDVNITDEHLAFEWVTISDFLDGKLNLPLILDEDACLKLIYSDKFQKP